MEEQTEIKKSDNVDVYAKNCWVKYAEMFSKQSKL